MLRLQSYLRSLSRNWWIVLLSVVGAVGATLIVNARTEPVYQTRLQLILVPNEAEFEGRDFVYTLYTLDRRSIISTYVEVLNSRRVFNETMSELNLSSTERARYSLSAVPLPDANIIDLTVRGPTPETVAVVANTAAENTIGYVQETYGVYRLDTLDLAPTPLRPIAPTPWRDTAVALILGLIVGGALAVLRDEIPHPVKTLQQRHILDHSSSAFTRSYIERHLVDLSQSGVRDIVLGLVQLNGLRYLDETLPRSTFYQILHQTTALLRQELRGKDAIGRWDEVSFILLMPVVSRSEAMSVLEQVQRSLIQPRHFSGLQEPILLNPRIGAVISEGDETPHILIERAQSALAEASMNGAKPVLYAPDVDLIEGS